jgi:hypothetical protein
MNTLPACQSKSSFKPGVSNIDEENTKRKRLSIADGTHVAKTRLFGKIHNLQSPRCRKKSVRPPQLNDARALHIEGVDGLDLALEDLSQRWMWDRVSLPSTPRHGKTLARMRSACGLPDTRTTNLIGPLPTPLLCSTTQLVHYMNNLLLNIVYAFFTTTSC